MFYAEGHPSYTGASADTQRNDTGQTGTEYTNRTGIYHFDAVVAPGAVELTGPCEIHLDSDAGAWYADFDGVGTADIPIRATYAPVNVLTVKGSNPSLQVVASVTGAVGSVPSNVKTNQALANFPFLMTDSVSHLPATGMAVSVTRSLDGAAFGAGALSSVTEVANGIYRVDFAAADLNGKTIILRATASGCDDTLERLVTTP